MGAATGREGDADRRARTGEGGSPVHRVPRRVRRAGARGRAPRERAATRRPLRAPRRGAGHGHTVDGGLGTITRRLPARAGRRRRRRAALPARSDPARARSAGRLAHGAYRSRARRRLRSLLAAMSAEGDRLQLGPPGRAPWRHWGPYLSERGWGTVREDYSATGHAWEFFPHDHARSRVYRWNEDGLGGICDDRQTLCFALAFWNGRDPILKERIFGLTGPRGQPRRGRQGVLVVPRLDPDALVDALALHVPAGGVPVRAARRRELLAREARSGVRARRHRDLRRGSLLGDHGRLREGVARGHADPDQRPERRPRGGDDRRAADDLVPQHLVVGHRREDAIDRTRERPSRRPSPRARHASPRRRRLARAAVLRQRDEPRAALAGRERVGVSEGRDQRPRHLRRPDRQSAADRDEGRAALPPAGRRRRDGDDQAASQRDRRARRRLRLDHARPRRRGGRVLRRADSRRHLRGRGARAAPGARGHALVEAVLPLRRAALARRRPGRPAAAGVTTRGPQPRVDAPGQHGRHLDAGYLGVPLVCGLGSRLPLRRARARRSRIREAPARPAVPRVVHAPERAAPRLRVGLRRRQPAGARVGRAARLRDRRR